MQLWKESMTGHDRACGYDLIINVEAVCLNYPNAEYIPITEHYELFIPLILHAFVILFSCL